MAKSGVASRGRVPRPSERGQRSDAAGLHRAPGLKFWLFAGVLLSLGMLFAYGLSRELANTRPAAQTARPAVATPRPAMTPAEEAYARALWEIHNEVKASALKMSMSGISLKLGQGERAEQRAQVEAAAQIYRRAEGSVLGLEPPASLRPQHDDYLAAVRLYQQAQAEMVRIFDDGDEQHLHAAFPLSQEGGRKLRAVGAVLWPNEYVPS